jgi:putative SOS response-associated peptidase YedK
MCGRYELHTHPAALMLAFGLPIPPTITPRYNIAPMQDVPVIRTSPTGERELSMVRWGLVPRWAKDPGIGSKMIEKPSFRTALRKHRCLIPANGFYEWKVITGGAKQPLHIGMKDGAPFAFAGLTERWLAPGGEVLDTCTIITTSANALLAPMHDRMPAIVAPTDYDRWLDVAVTEVADILAPYPATRMAYYPVSTRVNAVRHDDAGLIERIAEAEEPRADTVATDDATPARAAPPEQTELF